MAELSLPARDSVTAQADMFRRAKDEEGLGIGALSKRSPIPYGTLKGWSEGAAMPAWALGALATAGVPDHLLSLILEPFNRHVGTDETGETDYDDAAQVGLELAGTVQKARRPDSPGGPRIVHSEAAEIKSVAQRAVSIVRRVA